MSGDPTFAEALQRVREVTLGAYAHQDLPFEKLVEELQPERSLSYNPLCQVMFVLQNAPSKGQSPIEISEDGLHVDTGAAKLDLTLYMMEAGQEMIGAMEYNTDLYDAASINRILTEFEILLGNIAANPNARLSELIDMQEQAERNQRAVKTRSFKDQSLQKLRNTKRKTISG